MAACDSSLQTLAWEAEASWAEDVDTVTYGITTNDPVDFNTFSEQTMLEPQRVVSGRLDWTNGIPGPTGGSLSFTTHWTGHGSAMTGASTLGDLARLVGNTLGGSTLAIPAGDLLTGGTTTAVTTTTAAGSNQGVVGAILPIGALGDGDGEGQFYRVVSHATNTLTVLNALAGAPANGAQLYSADNAYPAASSCSLTGTRFRAQSADQQALLHGCYPTGFTITQTNPGDLPRLGFQYGVSWVEPISTTFPTTPTADTFSPSPVTADGSYFFNQVGTSTRSLLNVRQFAVNYQLGVVPVMGGNGVNAYQTITGATRVKDTCTVTFTVDAEGVDTTPTWWDRWLANGSWHLMATFNAKSASGQAIAVYFPNLCFTGRRPYQSTLNGRNVVNVEMYAKQGATTSDVTRAPMILGFS